MKKLFVVVLLLAFATVALAEEQRLYSVVGIVKSIHEDHVIVEKSNGREAKVVINENTQIVRGGRSVKKDEIREGSELSVETERDGETATFIKLRYKKKAAEETSQQKQPQEQQ